MYLLILVLPLMNSILCGLFGRFLGNYGTARLSVFFLVSSFLLSVLAFYNVIFNNGVTYIHIPLITWIDSELLYISWGLLFDSLTVVMLIVVTSISSLVHIYSISYMEHDPHRARFMAYLSLFTFFMLILVTANNFIQMFVGWEGVGLCSYLLINFWFTRLQANKAAIKAMLVNRIGDFALVLGILGIFMISGALDYYTVFACIPYLLDKTFIIFGFEFNSITLICILLFVGAMGKSAQIGLHTWLPDAMEGPTPVSALIHAATMVTAGVFMVARCSPLFEYSSLALIIVTIIGAMTAFFAATTGLLQNDLKRVIAYSTCSQLGYMVFACGISNYSAGIFHLANHAFFKALLFLGAGSVIHALADEQDMRKMGGLVRLLPFTYIIMLIGSISLMGFPFMTGFYSKDTILELAYGTYTTSGHFAFWLGTLAAFLTAFYSMRLLFLTFLSKTNAFKQSILNIHDAPFVLGFPLFILTFGSIFVGYIAKDMMVGLGTNFWGNSLFTLFNNACIFEADFLVPHLVKLTPVIFSIIGLFSAMILYMNFETKLFLIKISNIGRSFYTFLNRKWFFDKIYNEIINQNILSIGYNRTYLIIDRGIIEVFGTYSISKLLYRFSKTISNLQSGYIYHYALMMLLGVIILVTFIISYKFIYIYLDTRLIMLSLLSIIIFGNIIFKRIY